MTRITSPCYKTDEGNRITATHLLAKFTEESKIIRDALMGFQFLGKSGENASRDGDITRDYIDIGKSTCYESTERKRMSNFAHGLLKTF